MGTKVSIIFHHLWNADGKYYQLTILWKMWVYSFNQTPLLHLLTLLHSYVHNKQIISSVWCNLDTFQNCDLQNKSVDTPLSTNYFLTSNWNFQMMYCMKFYFKGCQNYKKLESSTYKFPFNKTFLELLTLTFDNSDNTDKSSYNKYLNWKPLMESKIHNYGG